MGIAKDDELAYPGRYHRMSANERKFHIEAVKIVEYARPQAH